MNIFRPQTHYVFRPPKYSPFLAPLLKKLSEIYFLKKKFRIRNITIEAVESVSKLAKEGHSLLIAPNHADHADPNVLVYIGSRHKLKFHFMAAREGFETRRLNSWLLQRVGAFSVDREGADISTIKTAMQILHHARYPLVIFPEGEIYHHHEKLDPLNEGVATILLRAANKLPEEKKAYLVPTAMRYTYDNSVETTFSKRLNTLEERITWKPRESMDVVDRIYRLGCGLLAIKEVEFLGSAQSGDLVERIANLRNKLVGMIEEKHQQREESRSTPERVKMLRNSIRKKITNPKVDLSSEEKESLYDDLDTLFVAVQLYSYPGQYLQEERSVHRIAETILKLEEDVLGEALYPAPRDVHVSFDEPLEIKNFLKERSLNFKTGVAPLTTELSDKIQNMLKELL